MVDSLDIKGASKTLKPFVGKVLTLDIYRLRSQYIFDGIIKRKPLKRCRLKNGSNQNNNRSVEMANEIVAEILRTEENGIEYFTVVATGESGISESGLSKGRLSEIPQKTLNRWLSDLSQNRPVKGLEALQGKVLHLSHNSSKRGGKLNIVKAKYAFEVLEFAAFERKDKTARNVLKLVGDIGLTHFIQVKTGWAPEQYKAAPQAHQQINRILDQPDPWKRLFEKEFCDRVIGWFGHQFYWDFVYCWMTPDERCKLNQVNPVRKEPNGRCDRLHRIHQFIEEETKERLHDEVVRLIAWVEASTSREDFLRLYNNAKGMGKQLPLL